VLAHVCQLRKFLVFPNLRAIGSSDSGLIPLRETTDLIRCQKLHILGTQFTDGGAECFVGERILVGH
jgi:hypothetical protein